MKITSLLENTAARSDMDVEHGLSLYIECLGKKILFDMGETSAFARNAERLGIDLGDVDLAVLSHGHSDHGGGLSEFMRINKTAPIYVSRYAFLPHYNGRDEYIGLDTSLAESDRLIYNDSEIKISDALSLDCCNDRERPVPFGTFGLTEKKKDLFIPDDFRHEQYLLIEEAGKRVLISGCSHKGILNLMDWFKPDTLVGGFHFFKMELGESLERAAAALDGYGCDYFTCHCTGVEQFDFMKNHMRRLNYLRCGDCVEI